MKKISISILAMAVVFSLASCGSRTTGLTITKATNSTPRHASAKVISAGNTGYCKGCCVTFVRDNSPCLENSIVEISSIDGDSNVSFNTTPSVTYIVYLYAIFAYDTDKDGTYDRQLYDGASISVDYIASEADSIVMTPRADGLYLRVDANVIDSSGADASTVSGVYDGYWTIPTSFAPEVISIPSSNINDWLDEQIASRINREGCVLEQSAYAFELERIEY